MFKTPKLVPKRSSLELVSIKVEEVPRRHFLVPFSGHEGARARHVVYLRARSLCAFGRFRVEA